MRWSLRGIDAQQADLIRDVVNEGLSPYVVAALGKDLHLTFILGRMDSSQPELPGLVLCGGTSLVRGQKLIARMSEDMDFKVSVDSEVSKNNRSLFLSGLKRQITSVLAEDGFVVENLSAHERNSFLAIERGYAPAFPIETALRPHILLEFTGESLFCARVLRHHFTIGSGYPAGAALGVFPLPSSRRDCCRSSGTGPRKPWDPRLVRHV